MGEWLDAYGGEAIELGGEGGQHQHVLPRVVHGIEAAKTIEKRGWQLGGACCAEPPRADVCERPDLPAVCESGNGDWVDGR